VDTEAESLEHAISPRLEQAIARYLGEPLEDPHGHPIPTQDGKLAPRKLQRLSDFQPGQWVLIREAQDEHPARLRRWHEQGLVPGARVLIRNYQELDDVFEVEVEGQIVRLGSEGLHGLRGEPAKPQPTGRAAPRLRSPS
jgi:DtxR family Mn-dependent transcriptional regulator